MATWILPCNTKYYDVAGAFENLPTLDWKQSAKNISEGDHVYIYLSSPLKEIRYKCTVIKANLPSADIDDSLYTLNGEPYKNFGRYMELKLDKEYENHELSREILVQHGLKSRMQCQMCASEELAAFIRSVDQKKAE